MNCALSFSGGKDSMLSLHVAKCEMNYNIKCLFTTTNQDIGSWFHDVDINILNAIAKEIDIDFISRAITLDNYNDDFEKLLSDIKIKYQLDGIIFGDIDIEEHLKWCQEICEKVGLKAIFPLFKMKRLDVVEKFIKLEYEAIVKRVDKKILSKDYLGKPFDLKLIEELKNMKIDSCGENGEFHTLVVNGPIFKNKIKLKKTEIKESENTYLYAVKLDE